MQDPPPRRLSTRGVVSLEWNRANDVDRPFAPPSLHSPRIVSVSMHQQPTAALHLRLPAYFRSAFLTEPVDQLQALAQSLAVRLTKLLGPWCDEQYLFDQLVAHRGCAMPSEQFKADAALSGHAFARRRAMLAELLASLWNTTPDQLGDAGDALVDELSAPLRISQRSAVPAAAAPTSHHAMC
jgi:hypothetical protein